RRKSSSMPLSSWPHRALSTRTCIRDTAHVLRSVVSGDLGSQGRQDRQGQSTLPAPRRCRLRSIMNMRHASYLGKIVIHTYLAATAAEVFEAATLGGPDRWAVTNLGRFSPGALADIIIDLTDRDTLRSDPCVIP